PQEWTLLQADRRETPRRVSRAINRYWGNQHGLPRTKPTVFFLAGNAGWRQTLLEVSPLLSGCKPICPLYPILRHIFSAAIRRPGSKRVWSQFLVSSERTRGFDPRGHHQREDAANG